MSNENINHEAPLIKEVDQDSEKPAYSKPTLKLLSVSSTLSGGTPSTTETGPLNDMAS